MRFLKLPAIAALLFALSGLSATAQELATAKVVSVTGTVTKYSPDGGNAPLRVGDLLREGDAVSATALSAADLVFSNGSEMTIEENTSVNFATLTQEAFSGGKTYAELEADPSTSQTVLELNFGKLSGHVKSLQSDSRFDVETPLGTAAIRGTTWATLLIYDAENEEFILSVENEDGAVDFFSRYVGGVQYDDENVGDKGYASELEESVREEIPSAHTVIVRLPKTDPLYDDLIQLIQNYQPTGPQPTPTAGPVPGDPDPEDDDGESDDFGIIVVSPEK